MQAIEVTRTVNAQGQLSLDRPLETFTNSRVKVIVLLPDRVAERSEEEADWSRLATEQFFKGYRDADAI